MKDSNWFTGPDWLWKENVKIPPPTSFQIEPNDPEVRINLKTECVSNMFNLNDRLFHVSKWIKAVKIVARIIRVCNKVKSKVCLSLEEIKKASDIIIQSVQKQFLTEEYNRISNKKILVKYK